MSDLEGVMLSDYLLQRCISKSGVADVYRGQQCGEGRYEVAVKLFRQGYAQRQSFREYFLQEAEKIGQFEHPHILPFLEYGEGEDLLYVVMPYISTGTIDDLLARVGGKLSALQALPIVQQLCSALQYAHERKMIHGNIKPQNVFVASDGRMLLSDFSIMRGFDDSQQSLTRVGWGSAEYASPEQSLGILRPASDIYALSVVLFRILTGVAPFTGQTPVEVLLKHVRQPAPSARTLVPTISDAVDEVLARALQKRVDERYKSAQEFGEAYQQAVMRAPVASPVARTMTAALTLSAKSATTPLLEPLGAQKILGQGTPDPITPVPMTLALDMVGNISGSESKVAELEEQSGGQDVEEDKEEEALLAGGKSATFWSVDPPEYSPIAQERAASDVKTIPFTAGEYLRREEERGEQFAFGEAKREEPVSREEKSLSAWMQRWLPLIVVLLLLLGLLGALFSAFFFPSERADSTLQAVQVALNL